MAWVELVVEGLLREGEVLEDDRDDHVEHDEGGEHRVRHEEGHGEGRAAARTHGAGVARVAGPLVRVRRIWLG